MKTFQQVLHNSSESLVIPFKPDLCFVFASRFLLEKDEHLASLRKQLPETTFFGCSTSGEISNNGISDDSCAITAIQFDGNTHVKAAEAVISDSIDSKTAGSNLSKELNQEGLRHVLILSDGQVVNGTELVEGLNEGLPESITATGGLAGDGARFEKTIVIDSEGNGRSGIVVALGFYGSDLEIGFGSMGGWESFGVERTVTKSAKNVLYEIDGQPALELYKSFLGENAKDLPASALLFPLNMRLHQEDRAVVRTILNVNEQDQSLVFAGDIPEGSLVQLMKSNSYKLIDGAEDAAGITKNQLHKEPDLALLVSCVGRKLVMKQLAEEEVEVVQEQLNAPTVTGFYSYGELAPFDAFMKCELHNQTMTITTLKD